MKISDLIKKLQEYKKIIGDVNLEFAYPVDNYPDWIVRKNIEFDEYTKGSKRILEIRIE